MVWRPAPGVRWRQVAAETVLLDLEAHVYYALDEVGAFAWESLSHGADLDAVAAAVTGAFDVDAETARRDLEQLVAALVEAGLLLPA